MKTIEDIRKEIEEATEGMTDDEKMDKTIEILRDEFYKTADTIKVFRSVLSNAEKLHEDISKEIRNWTKKWIKKKEKKEEGK